MTDISHPSIDDRRLPLGGAVNFRDLGGLRTSGNLCVKRGLAFRSDHLSRLTVEDHRILQGLQFKVVCDLRTIREQQRAPDFLPPDGSIRLLSFPVHADGFDPATAMERLRAGDDAWLSLDFFIRLYKTYLADFGPVWGRVFSLIASAGNLPLVFHCTGGKDRTGICAALLLKTLGVSEEHILLDHVRSNACNARRLESIYSKFAALGIRPEKASLFLQAHIEPLVAMLEHLDKSYGTIEDYLQGQAGMDRAAISALRSRLLE